MLTQQLLNGITIGSIYALIALGYTMVYGIIQLVNFAHGEIVMMGTYFALMFLVSFHIPPLATALLSMSLAALLGVLIERIAYRPLRRRGKGARLTALVSALGVSIFLQNCAMFIWGTHPLRFPEFLPNTSTSYIELDRNGSHEQVVGSRGIELSITSIIHSLFKTFHDDTKLTNPRWLIKIRSACAYQKQQDNN